MTTASISATPTRLVALHGGCNFRDIGGYPTQSGRVVRWGRVYRAGVLSKAERAAVARKARHFIEHRRFRSAHHPRRAA